MYTVLLAVDSSESRALDCARTVSDLPAAASEVEVTVFHVFGDNPSGASATQVASVRRAVEHLEDAGVEVHIRDSSGDPADEILDEAEKLDADLVCVGGRKRSAAGKALFGSVTQSVILHSNRPVVVSGHEEQ